MGWFSDAFCTILAESPLQDAKVTASVLTILGLLLEFVWMLRISFTINAPSRRSDRLTDIVAIYDLYISNTWGFLGLIEYVFSLQPHGLPVLEPS